MEKINHSHIEYVKKDKSSKSVPCNTCSETMLQFVYSQNNLFQIIKGNFKNYELALWVKANEFYIKRKKTFHSNRYYPREIIWVDLGSNVGNELSYEHPCVIIKNDFEKVFVVPCSSSKVNKAFDKNGNLYPEYLIGDVTHGFTTKTAIILNNAKWISKSRILKKHSKKMHKNLYNDMYEKLFGMIFESRQYTIKKLSSELDIVNKKFEDLILELDTANKKLENLQRENEHLNAKFDQNE